MVEEGAVEDDRAAGSESIHAGARPRRVAVPTPPARASCPIPARTGSSLDGAEHGRRGLELSRPRTPTEALDGLAGLARPSTHRPGGGRSWSTSISGHRWSSRGLAVVRFRRERRRVARPATLYGGTQPLADRIPRGPFVWRSSRVGPGRSARPTNVSAARPRSCWSRPRADWLVPEVLGWAGAGQARRLRAATHAGASSLGRPLGRRAARPSAATSWSLRISRPPASKEDAWFAAVELVTYCPETVRADQDSTLEDSRDHDDRPAPGTSCSTWTTTTENDDPDDEAVAV